MISGIFVGGAFSFAAVHHGSDIKASISPLLFADLLGGSLASILGALIFIPLIGMTVSVISILILSLLLFSVI